MKHYAGVMQVTSVGSFSFAGFIGTDNNPSMSKSVVAKRSGVRQEGCCPCDIRLGMQNLQHLHHV